MKGYSGCEYCKMYARLQVKYKNNPAELHQANVAFANHLASHEALYERATNIRTASPLVRNLFARVVR